MIYVLVYVEIKCFGMHTSSLFVCLLVSFHIFSAFFSLLQAKMFPGRKITFIFDMQDTGLVNMVS